MHILSNWNIPKGLKPNVSYHIHPVMSLGCDERTFFFPCTCLKCLASFAVTDSGDSLELIYSVPLNPAGAARFCQAATCAVNLPRRLESCSYAAKPPGDFTFLHLCGFAAHISLLNSASTCQIRFNQPRDLKLPTIHLCRSVIWNVCLVPALWTWLANYASN